MSAPNHKLLIDRIVESVQTSIMRGDIPAGAKLSENSVAEEFSCSRTPVREAFKRLELAHLVEIVPHSGTYVRELTDEENLEVTEVRAALEALAFRLACRRKADATVLRTIQEQMETALGAKEVDFATYGRAHVLFHRHLVELSGNALLLQIWNNLNLSSARKLIYAKMNPGEIRLTNQEHDRIAALLEEGNEEEGQKYVFSHLWKKRSRLLG